MVWEYKITKVQVLKGKASLKFDFDEAVEKLNELGRTEWELVSVSIVGSEAMLTLKRPQAQLSAGDPLWK